MTDDSPPPIRHESSPIRHELRLDLPAAHRPVRVARNVMRHFARMQGMVDREIEYLVLVTSELLANAIDHGGGEAALTETETSSRMVMEFLLLETEWSLRVTDQGGGDPDQLRAMFASQEIPDTADDRGRGLFLLSQMVDRMEVERSESGEGLTFHAVRRYRS
jgi:anti-sigma regulatory factor (Ser/Thr protein kinase)